MAAKTKQKAPGQTPPVVYQSESLLWASLKRLIRHKLAVLGIIILSSFLIAAIFANQLGTHPITSQNLRNRFAPPNRQIVVPTDILLHGNLRLTAFSSGEVFARDAQMNLPRWQQALEAGATSLAAGHDAAYVGAEDGTVTAFGLDRGNELWTATVSEQPQAMWVTEGGLFVQTNATTIHQLDDRGNSVALVRLEENIASLFPYHLAHPVVVTTNGSVYRIEQGEAILWQALPVNTVDLAFLWQEQLYYLTEGSLAVYHLDNHINTSLPNLPPNREYRIMTKFADMLLISDQAQLFLGYDLTQTDLRWESTIEDALVNIGHDMNRAIQIATDRGRILAINPQTGGITSSRMLEGYKDINYLGTDELGRDVFSRILAGGRVSLSLGILVSFIGVIIGSTVGAITGYYGGWIDNVLMRCVDFMLAIPQLPMLMLISYILGPSFRTMTIVLVLFGWMTVARIVRSQTLSLKQQEFFMAARALGVSTPRIIFFHLLPNVLGPIIVAATLQVGSAILSESQLSYLGLGIQPPTPSWGNMLMNARSYLTTAPGLALWPGLCIFLVLLAINFIGDGMRDALDPKLKGR